MWQVDGEQTIQVVAEKRDTVTWLGGVRDKLVEEAARQACLERAPAGCADAQAVSLQAIHRSMIALEDLDFDVVPLQPLCQAQATCSCSNDADPEPFVVHLWCIAHLSMRSPSRSDRPCPVTTTGFGKGFGRPAFGRRMRVPVSLGSNAPF